MCNPTPEQFAALTTPDACLVVMKSLIAEVRHAGRANKPNWPNGIEPLMERRFQQGVVFAFNADFRVINQDVERKLAPAWKYAHDNAYLYKNDDGFSLLTNEGVAFAESGIHFQSVAQLDKLHDEIRNKVEPQFLVAKNSDAIALAFNEVESIAKALAWPNVDPPARQWIEQAFDVEQAGPLVNRAYNATEQRSTRNLFLGAFGLFRNEHAHLNPEVSEHETLYILGLASLLMIELDKLRA